MAVMAFQVRAICMFHFEITNQKVIVPTGAIYPLFEAGHFGVQLFFTIGGFVLAVPFAREKLCGASHVS